MGGGAAFLDYNNDGKIRHLLVRGSTLKTSQNGAMLSVRFIAATQRPLRDVTRAAGWRIPAAGAWVSPSRITITTGEDILVTGYGATFCFATKHDGTSEEVAEKAA